MAKAALTVAVPFLCLCLAWGFVTEATGAQPADPDVRSICRCRQYEPNPAG